MRKKLKVEAFTPINDQVIIKIIKETSVSSGGILIPDGAGFEKHGGAADFYKVEIIKYTDEAVKVSPDIKDNKYGIVSIYSGHYIITDEGSYKIIPAFMLVAVTNNNKFTAESLKPTANRVLVKEYPKSDRLDSGLFISGAMTDPRESDTLEGVVIKVGVFANPDIVISRTAIYDPYVGNVLPRLQEVEEVDAIEYVPKRFGDKRDYVSEVTVTRKEKVIYKVVHDRDITAIY